MNTDKKDEVIARLSMAVIYLSILVFVLIILLLSLYFYTPPPSQIKEEYGLCGNAVAESAARNNYPDYDLGGKVFMQNCAVCHSLGSNLITGPGLKDAVYRIPGGNWLKQYILNSEKMFKKKDPYTLKLRTEFPTERMTAFEEILNEKEIDAVIHYMKGRQQPVVMP